MKRCGDPCRRDKMERCGDPVGEEVSLIHHGKKDSPLLARLAVFLPLQRLSWILNRLLVPLFSR